MAAKSGISHAAFERIVSAFTERAHSRFNELENQSYSKREAEKEIAFAIPEILNLEAQRTSLRDQLGVVEQLLIQKRREQESEIKTPGRTGLWNTFNEIVDEFKQSLLFCNSAADAEPIFKDRVEKLKSWKV